MTKVAENAEKKFAGKVAVLNFSGNVGKSTVARHVLMGRMDDPAYIAVESINADEGEGDTVRGKQWGQLQEELMMMDSAVVDVGASNVEDFIKLVQQYRGSHEEFDLFVVPVVAESKQIRDTIATIDALHAIGVPSKKIRVVFNRLEVDETVEDNFWPLIAYHQDKARYTLREEAVIGYSELYHKMRTHRMTIEDLMADDTNWRAKLKEAKTDAEKQRAAAMISMRRLAITAKENLDAVFATIVAPAK